MNTIFSAAQKEGGYLNDTMNNNNINSNNSNSNKNNRSDYVFPHLLRRLEGGYNIYIQIIIKNQLKSGLLRLLEGGLMLPFSCCCRFHGFFSYYIHIRIYVYIYRYTHTHTHTHTHTCMCLYLCTYMYTDIPFPCCSRFQGSFSYCGNGRNPPCTCHCMYIRMFVCMY